MNATRNFRFTIFYCMILCCPVSAQETASRPEADAVILLDENEMQINPAGKASFTKHRLILVNAPGGKKYGEVTLSTNKYLSVKNIKADLKDVSGKLIRKMKNEEIQSQMLSPEYILFDDTRYFHFEMSQSTFPYVLEYAYEYEFSSLFFWPDWFPQADVPVLKSTYKLIMKEEIPFQTHALGFEEQPRLLLNQKYKTWLWEADSISAKTDESYLPPEHEIQMAVHFVPATAQLEKYPISFQSWKSFGNWFYHLYTEADNLPSSAFEKSIQLRSQSLEPKEKIRQLYAWLQEYTRYVAILPGISGWRPHSIESIFQNRYGDCKDLSILLATMLSKAQIPAYPVLIKTRDEGVLLRDLPNPDFNHVMVVVPLANDTLWLECTADYLAAGEIPWADEGCDVLVVKPTGGEIWRTPESSASQNTWQTTIHGSISVIGDLSFSGRLRATGEVANSLRNYLNDQKTTDQKRWLSNRLGRYQPGMELIYIQMSNLEQNFERPLEIMFAGKIPKFASRSANRLFINPAILSRWTADDLPREKERRFPVFFHYSFQEVDSVFINLPPGYQLEASINPVHSEPPFGFFQIGFSVDERQLIYCRTNEIRQRKIPVVQFQDFTNFLTRVVKVDQSKFVFRVR